MTVTENVTEDVAEEMTEADKAPEIQAVNLDEYAASNQDSYVSLVWPQMATVRVGIQAITTDLGRFSPPTQMEIYEYLKTEDAKKDKVLKSGTEEIAKLEETLNKLKAKVHARAKEVLRPEALPEEELAKQKSQLSSMREALMGQIDAVKIYLEAMSKVDPSKLPVLKAFEELRIPRAPYGLSTGDSGNTTRNPRAQAIRDWAKANGMTVSERGRISAEVEKAYDAANPS